MSGAKRMGWSAGMASITSLALPDVQHQSLSALTSALVFTYVTTTTPPRPHLIGVDGVRKRAARVEVGQQNAFGGIEDGGRLSHEVDAAEEDDLCICLCCCARQAQRVADHVGDVLNLGHLVVVRQDYRL